MENSDRPVPAEISPLRFVPPIHKSMQIHSRWARIRLPLFLVLLSGLIVLGALLRSGALHAVTFSETFEDY